MPNIASQNRSVKRLLRKLILTFACKVSLIPSKSVRPWLCRHAGVNIPDPASVFIGDGVRFDDISPEKISIGRNTRITSGVCILNHFLDIHHSPTENKPFQFLDGEVSIGENVFIGLNAVICKPVNIGNKVIIGAGAIVTKDVQDYSIVAGVPARIIGRYGVKDELQ